MFRIGNCFANVGFFAECYIFVFRDGHCGWWSADGWERLGDASFLYGGRHADDIGYEWRTRYLYHVQFQFLRCLLSSRISLVLSLWRHGMLAVNDRQYTFPHPSPTHRSNSPSTWHQEAS
jgi:hypothetical protein